MLPILCILEPKFFKTGVNLLASSNKPLYLLSMTKFLLFENSRNVTLQKKMGN